MTRPASLGPAGVVILAGFLLRLVPWGLPLPVHHDGVLATAGLSRRWRTPRPRPGAPRDAGSKPAGP